MIDCNLLGCCHFGGRAVSERVKNSEHINLFTVTKVIKWLFLYLPSEASKVRTQATQLQEVELSCLKEI